MIVTPKAVHWSLVSSADLAIVNRNGERVSGPRIPDLSAVIIHWPIHDARPDARCLIHVHALYSTALFMRHGVVLETRASQPAMSFHQRVAYFDEYDGNLSSEDEGRRMARVLGDKDVLVMRNHGVLVAGESVGMAFDRILTFELACPAANPRRAVWIAQFDSGECCQG